MYNRGIISTNNIFNHLRYEMIEKPWNQYQKTNVLPTQTERDISVDTVQPLPGDCLDTQENNI